MFNLIRVNNDITDTNTAEWEGSNNETFKIDVEIIHVN